ncbi:MFS transporter [Streptomyces daliensis]
MERPPESTPAATEPPGQGSAHAGGAHEHRWLILGVIGIAQLMVVLDATIVNIALPSAQQDLGFDDGSRQWIVTAYSLAFGSLLLLGGRIADLVGRKRIFIIGLVGFALASALGGAATGFDMLVTARALQGIFGALLAPAALSLLTTTFTDPQERAKAFGVCGAIAGAGGAVGLLLGGVLTEYLDWRWCLFVNIGFAVVAVIGGAVLLRGGRPDDRPELDIPGTILVTTGLFCIVYGFSNAETHDWSDAEVWGFLVAGAVLLALFAWWQTRAAHPLLPLRVVLDRTRGASFLAMFVAGVGMFGVFLFLTYYLQQILEYSPVSTGVAFLPMVVFMVASSMLATNVVVPRFGPKLVVPLGMALAAGAMAWLTALGLDSSYAAHVLPPLCVAGIGMGQSSPRA